MQPTCPKCPGTQFTNKTIKLDDSTELNAIICKVSPCLRGGFYFPQLPSLSG
jgi:hypothetical protein